MRFKVPAYLRLALSIILALVAVMLPWNISVFRENIGLLLPFFLIVLAGIFGASSLKHIQVKKKFGQRESLKLDQIYSKFYSSSGINYSEFEQAWIAISQALRIDPSVLRPSDRFGIEIKASWSIDSEIDALESLCRRSIQNFDANRNAYELRTIDEVLRALAHKDRNRALVSSEPQKQ